MTTYQFLIKIYKFLPIKKAICTITKISRIRNDKFYKDLRFNGKFKVSINRNLKFKLFHFGGSIENETFWKGLFVTFENETGWLWLELSKRANTIFDIGANTGIYSLVSKTIKSNSAVYAFEPSKNSFHKLKKNIILNKFDIEHYKLAVSNKIDNVTFFDFKDPNQTSASLSAEMYRNNPDYNDKLIEYNVKTIRLSDFIESNNIKNLDLIKIDVEMHEPEVIEGLGKYLVILKPTILIEVLNNKVAHKLNKLIPKDYLIFHLDSYRKMKIVKSLKRIEDKWNYLLVHSDHYGKLLENEIIKNSIV